MSININASFNLSRDDFIKLIPSITNMTVTYSEKEEKLKLFLLSLYLHMYQHKVDKLTCNKLWDCIISNDILSNCLIFLQQTSSSVVHDYFKSKVNDKTYASIIEDDDFYNQLIDLILDDEIEQMDQAEVDEVLNVYKKKPVDDMLEQLLIKMDIDEEGRKKAREIKNDMTDGKPDMNKVMNFIAEYKSKFDASNIDFNTLYTTMVGKKEESPLPFDINSMMSMFTNLASMQPQKSKRGRRR